MGILNITPDSFSSDGILCSPQKAVRRALEMEKEGADLLDLGAESTRPGARLLSQKEEIGRLLPTLKKIRNKIQIPISIDTQNSETARLALEEGAQIINDVSGLQKDSRMAGVVARLKAGLILMHGRGNAKTMMHQNRYQNLVTDVIKELKVSLKKAADAGIIKGRIAIDPGVGFAKIGNQNIELIRSIERIRKIGYPICLGISRKSFIGALTGQLPQERDYGTTALHSLMIERGVNILRTHNVRAAKQAVLVTQNFLKRS